MTTYTDEVNIYNPEAIGDAIDDAALTADNYLTDITGGGVMVHPSGDSTSGWRIASALELIKGGITYIKAWLNGSTPTVTIGDTTSGNCVLIDDDSFDVKHAGTNIIHFGYDTGNAESGAATAPYYTIGSRYTLASDYNPSITYSVGTHCIHDGENYVCTTDISEPEAWNSSHWKLSIGNYSLATGKDVTACGYGASALGYRTSAIKAYDYVEGSYSIANGTCAHAEGNYTVASGDRSHAEGQGSKATGSFSHAQNRSTIAASEAQTTLGKYNVEDANDAYAVIVGNGTADDARSNALGVTWDGDVELGSSGNRSIKSNSEVILNAAYKDATQYRFCHTNAGNIRMEKSTDYGATWATDTYFMRGRNSLPSSTTTVANVLTPVSGVCTITNVNAAVYGRICMLHVTIKLLSAQSAGNIGNVALATMNSNYYPLFAAALTSSGTGPLASGYISTDHKLYLAALGGAVAANNEISLAGTYILAN